jgi:hypothetical protein
MPITRNSDDYLELIQQDILDHSHITLPKATIKTILDQFQQSIHHHLNQANQIDLSPFLTIHPSLPLIKCLKAKYYNTQKNTSPAMKHILKVARQARKQCQVNPNTPETSE